MDFLKLAAKVGTTAPLRQKYCDLIANLFPDDKNVFSFGVIIARLYLGLLRCAPWPVVSDYKLMIS